MPSEVAIAAVFIVAAVAGFKRSPWFAVVALGRHGVMDAFHDHLVHNIGVPQVWPGFCMSNLTLREGARSGPWTVRRNV